MRTVRCATGRNCPASRDHPRPRYAPRSRTYDSRLAAGVISVSSWNVCRWIGACYCSGHWSFRNSCTLIHCRAWFKPQVAIHAESLVEAGFISSELQLVGQLCSLPWYLPPDRPKNIPPSIARGHRLSGSDPALLEDRTQLIVCGGSALTVGAS
jgi:hypothetical protein